MRAEALPQHMKALWAKKGVGFIRLSCSADAPPRWPGLAGQEIVMSDTPQILTLTVPVAPCPPDVYGGSQTSGRFHIDIGLTYEQHRAAADLRTGLVAARASLNNGNLVQSAQDVTRWLFEHVARGLATGDAKVPTVPASPKATSSSARAR